MQTWSPPLRGLCLGLLLLGAPHAGAEEIRLAQAETGAEEPSPPPAPPASNIEEIVVLGAESESAGDFGAADSVTGFGAEDLAALGAQNIADLASFTPNLEIVTSGATTPTFFIRGVGLNDFNANSTGAVSIYQDDVAINAPAIQLGTLFDVEAVNILRGPQGTGQARNSSAGAIKIYSRKPTGELGGYLRTDIGNYDFRDYEGAVEAPIYEDLLSGRVAFRLSERDGTMRNRCGGAPPPGARPVFPGASAGFGVDPPWSICGEPVDSGGPSPIAPGLERFVNNVDNWAGRATVLFEPTLDTTFLVNVHAAERDELSRLGQAIGTGGSFCFSGDICAAPFRGVPPEVRGAPSVGLLGGFVNGGSGAFNYRPREISARLNELVPCLRDGNCNSSIENRIALNRGKIALAEELADKLDSKPWQGDFNSTGPTELESRGGYVKADIALPFGIDFSSTSGYDTYDRIIDIDLDFSPETLFHIITDDEAWQYYQDITFEGALGDGWVDWEVGGFMLREELDVVVINDFGDLQAIGVGGREYSQDVWSAAGYGSFSFDFWEDFTLDGGFRYNWEKKELQMLVLAGNAQGQGSFLLEDTWNAPTGTIRLTYRFRDDTHAFWKYTRGWKPGTYNATASQFTGPTIAEPEEIDSFETGISGSWFEGKVNVNGSFFYYAYSDYQIFTAQQFLGGNPEFVILNANDAEVYGTEVDASARPWDGAFWNVRFSWLESQFLDFVKTDQFLSTRGGGSNNIVQFREQQNSGNPLLNSPRFKVSLTAEQSLPLGRYGSLTFRYDGVWTDKTYYDPTRGPGLGDAQGNKFLPSDTIAQNPYWLHNGRVTWRAPGGRFEIAAWMRNIENKAYKTFAFDGSSFRKTTIYFVGDPRTFGLSAAVSF